MVEKIGLEALFEDKQFQAGIKKYTESIIKATRATEAGAAGMNTGLGNATKGVAGLSIGGIALGNILANIVTKGITAVISVISKMIDLMKQAAGAILEFGKNAILTSARLQEMALVTELLGARFGFTQDEIQGITQSVIDYGIRTDTAQNLVATFLRRQLDLAKATDLARVAQDAAVLSMTDSSTALDKLLIGIQTLNIRTLRNAGINITAKQAYAAFTEQTGIAAEAMTVAQQQQAFLNAVLAEGINIAGVYEKAMESPAKRLRSLSRLMFELSASVGAPFQDAFGNVVTIMETVVKGFAAAVSEGGALFPILQQLGAFAAVVTEGLSSLAAKAIPAFIDFAVKAAEVLSQVARDALEWGIEISVQLATGIIQGASSAIVAAMNFIARLLQSWLSPGSPPRVAPDIDKWGAGTMDVWLEGFKDANFKILEDLKDPLEDALGGLIGDDSVSAEILEKLLDLNLSLAEATKKVEIAESRLEAARIARGQAQVKINGLIAEHNQLLREGADQDVLDAKLEEINAAEELRDQAAAEEAALENRVRLGRLLVDILGQQEEAQKGKGGGGGAPKLDEDALGGGGGGGLGGLGIELPEVDTVSLTTSINSAFEELKKNAADALSDLFEPIVTAWEEDWQPAIDELGESWDTFTSTVAEFWDEKVQPVVDKFAEFIPPDLLANIGKVIGVVLVLGGVLAVLIGIAAAVVAAFLLITGTLALLVTLIVNPFTIAGAAIALFGQKVVEIFNAIKAKVADTFAKIKTIVTTAVTTVKAKFTEIGTKVAEIVGAIKTEFETKFGKPVEDLITALGELRDAIAIRLNLAIQNIINKFTDIKNKLTTAVTPAVDKLKTAFDTVKKFISGAFTTALTAVQTLFQEVRDKITNVVGPALTSFKTNVLDVMETAWNNVAKAIQWVIEKVIELIKKLAELVMPDDFQESSPSPFEQSLRNAAKAMDDLSGKSIPNLQAGLDIDDPSANINRKLKSGLLTPALLPELNQQIFTIGGNTVNNGMDMAIFEANVIRIIKREVSG